MEAELYLMSEYQHYEFHTVGRKLSRKEQSEAEALSSHITVGVSSAWVDYEWGDFKHDPIKVLERTFDLFVYDSNWGSQQIAFRWDAGSVDVGALECFAVDEVITVTQKKGSIVFHAAFDENIQEYLFNARENDSGIRFALLTSLVREVQKRDYRCLYLLWLKASELAGLEDSGPQPPPGLWKLTEGQKMLVRFLGIDGAQLTKARKKSGPLGKAKGRKPVSPSSGSVDKIRLIERKSAVRGPDAEDPEREHRILMEAVVDAYGPDEQAMGWYCHLENKINFPFKARIRKRRGTNTLREGASVRVLGMADSDECSREMFVTIATGNRGESYDVPLDQIDPLESADEETVEAVLDWHYWMERGYSF